MPVYDYACSACGRVTEVIHGIHDAGPRFCPACGAEGSMRKTLSTPAIVFKGSGWAKVDRRSAAGGGGRSGGSGSKAAGAPKAAAGDGSSGATSGSSAPHTSGGDASSGTRDTPSPSRDPAPSGRSGD